MLPLAKLRLIYIKRHPCKFCFNYIFLSSILLFYTIIYYSEDYRESDDLLKLKEDNLLKNDINLNISENYNNKKIDTLYIICEDDVLRKDFVNFIKNNSEISNIKELSNENIIDIDDNNLNDYTIILNKKENNTFQYFFKNNQENHIFKKYFFDKKELQKDFEIEMKFHSICSNYLINKSSKKESNNLKDLKINYELNSIKSFLSIFKLKKDKHIDIERYYMIKIYSILIYGTIFLNFVSRLLDEKEKKLDILLSRYGILEIPYITSWLITFLILISYPIIILTIAARILLFTHINILFIFVNQIIFVIALFSFCCFLNTILKTLKQGQTFFKFIFFGITALSGMIYENKINIFLQIIFLLFPFSVLLINLQVLAELDLKEKIIFFKRFDGMNLFLTYIFYLIEIVFYLGFTILYKKYKDSGVSIWKYLTSCCSNNRHNNNINRIEDEIENTNEENEMNHEKINQKNTEFKNNRQFLNIINLTKIYGNLFAVNKFNGEMFPNEIFCLLGHNGAGKTTLINMISGIEDPNFGDILLNEHSIVTDKKFLYKNIGLCSQENIFFEYLTVKEHLQYMCEIKGSSANPEEINTLINQIDLSFKSDYMCKTLSGGQKRKLCIALALIGNSNIILLDEPTSGMDVVAKRELWKFLKNYKSTGNKIIILTTHSLEEAEYLGDRIGIMLEGKFVCSGTSSYLKNRYPCGYNLNIIFNSNIFSEEDKEQLLNNLKKIEPSIELKISSKSVLSFNIENINKNNELLLKEVERQKTLGKIEDFTISTTTLEDVFLKINNSNIINSTTDLILNNNNMIEGYSNVSTQLKANLIRNLIPLYRNPFGFIFELISSLIIIIIYIIIFYVEEDDDDDDDDLFGLFNKKQTIYINNETKYYLNNVNSEYFNYEELDYNSNYLIDKYFSEDKKNLNNIVLINENNSNLTNFYVLGLNSKEKFTSTISLIISAFLKDAYNINVEIGNKVGANLVGDTVTTVNTFYLALTLICLLSFCGYMINKPIVERIRNIKYLLYLSGCNLKTYWVSFLLVDFLKYLIFFSLVYIPILTFKSNFWFVILYTIPFIFAMNAFIYCFSFTISNEEQGLKSYFILLTSEFFIILILMYIFYIISSSLFKFIFKSFEKPYLPSLLDINPLFSYYAGIVLIIDNDRGDSNKKMFITTMYLTLYMIGEFIFWFLLLILIEKKIIGKCLNNLLKKLFFNKKDNFEFGKLTMGEDTFGYSNNIFIDNNNINNINETNNIINTINNNNNIINNNTINNSNNLLIPSSLEENLIDSNVNINNVNKYIDEEMKKISKNKTGNYVLSTTVENLTKTYLNMCCQKNVRAVDHLYLGLEPNEKFGLLGFNGSGKTTTFKAITNQIFFDEGEITVFGYNTKTNFENVRNRIGFCPQENPLFDYLTVRETLNYYKSLKKSNLDVNIICEKFGISSYIDKYCTVLSEGNKRKLVFAIALMNQPSFLLLDEPSSGVDPKSRRLMWKNINELSKNVDEFNMILTTHSIEEAEVLCDTVSWLKNGNFKCVGNPEKLKLMYSSGYKLHIKFNDEEVKKIVIQKNQQEIVNDCIKLNIIDLHLCNAFFSDINFIKYFYLFYQFLNKIVDKCSNIQLNEVGKDYSFRLTLYIKKENQSQLFSNILNMKNENNLISETNIKIEPLENILTSL